MEDFSSLLRSDYMRIMYDTCESEPEEERALANPTTLTASVWPATTWSSDKRLLNHQLC